MDFFYLRIASLIIIATVYMLFDVFNKRNVPTVFAYATLAYGLALTLLYQTPSLIYESVGIALVVIGVGYVVYKIGQIGAADIIEFAAISLMLPLQPVPFLAGMPSQFGLPTIISVFVCTGMVALVTVPLYYLPKARRMTKKPLLSFVSRQAVLKSALITSAYLLFIIFMFVELRIMLAGVAILLIMLIFSTLMIIFEKPITDSMVEYVDYRKFDEGDIVAFNLMTLKQIAAIKKKVRSFDRLLSAKLISEMRAKRVSIKLPVYKDAVPLALPILVGVIISLTLGNLIFFILP
ncbi:MAG TPA: prepilin peptidase [Candidatus Acidoferrales bacterium]|nr:prepilin peptidase [Candidatus Acidoferrales bacterium]